MTGDEDDWTGRLADLQQDTSRTTPDPAAPVSHTNDRALLSSGIPAIPVATRRHRRYTHVLFALNTPQRTGSAGESGEERREDGSADRARSRSAGSSGSGRQAAAADAGPAVTLLARFALHCSRMSDWKYRGPRRTEAASGERHGSRPHRTKRQLY